MILLFIGMSQSSKNSRSTPKPYYNKHFLRSFKLNYGEAFANLSNDKILCRLHDWNCEWLSRPNIAISEMASTLKDNWTHIMAYRRTVFAESFVHDLRTFVDPITDALRRLDNKDKLDTDPLDADDVVGILKSIYKDPWVEDLFTNAFNAVGPIMMMAVHVLVANCLMHNPDAFAERSVCAPSSEKFKTDPTFQNMMRYLIDSILLRRRNVQRSPTSGIPHHICNWWKIAMKHARADPKGAWPIQIRQPKAPLLDPRRPEDVSPHRLQVGPDKTQGPQQPLRPDVDPPSTLVEYVP